MRSDSHDEDTTPELVAEMHAIVDETRRTIEASQAILDRCGERSAAGAPPAPEQSCADALDLLGEISDGLIHAYRFAKQDGDPLTVTLIEKALFHIGRRLAREMSPAQFGISCH